MVLFITVFAGTRRFAKVAEHPDGIFRAENAFDTRK
jgi:hypothetical protein